MYQGIPRSSPRDQHATGMLDLIVRVQRKLGEVNGTPGGTRTPDLLLRRQLLYPAELLAHFYGAGDGNRTRVSSLEGWCSTIELHPQSPDLTDSARAFYHIIFLLSRGQFRIFRFCRKKNRLQTEPVPELTWRIPQPWFPESH